MEAAGARCSQALDSLHILTTTAVRRKKKKKTILCVDLSKGMIWCFAKTKNKKWEREGEGEGGYTDRFHFFCRVLALCHAQMSCTPTSHALSPHSLFHRLWKIL